MLEIPLSLLSPITCPCLFNNQIFFICRNQAAPLPPPTCAPGGTPSSPCSPSTCSPSSWAPFSSACERTTSGHRPLIGTTIPPRRLRDKNGHKIPKTIFFIKTSYKPPVDQHHHHHLNLVTFLSFLSTFFFCTLHPRSFLIINLIGDLVSVFFISASLLHPQVHGHQSPSPFPSPHHLH